jgi:uncharacterized protein (TIGR00730 family)
MTDSNPENSAALTPDNFYISVFCGSSFGVNPVYVETTIAFGKLIAQKKLGLIYGGGNTGLMGVLADTVLEAGGEVIGVIPKALFERERAHQNLTKLHVVHSMHERKALMDRLSHGSVALPGGLGTFDEFIEIITWNQLKFINKPAGLLNVTGYFDHLIAQINFAVEEGFVSSELRDKILVDTNGETLLERVISSK